MRCSFLRVAIFVVNQGPVRITTKRTKHTKGGNSGSKQCRSRARLYFVRFVIFVVNHVSVC